MTLALAPPTIETRRLDAVSPEGLGSFLRGLPSPQVAFLNDQGFAAQAQRLVLLPGPEGVAGAVLGLGDTPGDSPWAFGGLATGLPEGSAWRLGAGIDVGAATLGWLLGGYGFDRYRAGPGRRPAMLAVSADDQEASRAIALARAIHLGRDLINMPAEACGPGELATAVAELAARYGARAEVIEGDALREGFPALHAVGRAAAPGREPRVAALRWGDPAHPLLALCGKGVCFDTGGLDIKPAEAMRRMKKDMGGAAMLLSLAEALMANAVPVRLLLLVGAVENSIGPDAFRPGDVVRTRKGLSVEIGNTDAEGRLVLADLLTFAAEQEPALILDAATLTGAARVALGPDLPALFSSDAAWASSILSAGERVHDPVWRLPLHGSYDSWLDSPVADLNNVASRPMAGAVVAALFLRRFVPASVAWMHIDTYAWNDAARPGRPEGGECQSMRACFAAVAEWATRNAAAPRTTTLAA